MLTRFHGKKRQGRRQEIFLFLNGDKLVFSKKNYKGTKI
jgi:hypothetical protein